MGKVGKKPREYAQQHFDKELAFKLTEHLHRGDIRRLSEKMDMSYCMMHNYLRGNYSMTVYRFLQLAKAMRVDVKELLDGFTA